MPICRRVSLDGAAQAEAGSCRYECSRNGCLWRAAELDEAVGASADCLFHPGVWSPDQSQGHWHAHWSCCGATWLEPGCARGHHAVVDLLTAEKRCRKCGELFVLGNSASSLCTDGAAHVPKPLWPDEDAQHTWDFTSVDGHSWTASTYVMDELDPEMEYFLRWCFSRTGWDYYGFSLACLHQVAARVVARLRKLGRALHPGGLKWYKAKLERESQEFFVLDSMFCIGITRFNRDPIVMEYIRTVAMPSLSDIAGEAPLRIWCCGCATGEEVWTLKMYAEHFPTQRWTGDDLAAPRIELLGTDCQMDGIQRARRARYILKDSSIKRMPQEWLDSCLSVSLDNGQHVVELRPEMRENVQFKTQDVRDEMPEGLFHIILCRHSVFEYFDANQRSSVLRRMLSHLHKGGYLVVGINDKIPAGFPQLQRVTDSLNLRGIYRSTGRPRVQSLSCGPRAAAVP